MSFTLRELLLHYIGLLAIFSPVAAISPFMDLTSQYPRKIQLKIAFRASLFAFFFLLIGSWVGKYILLFLGITIPALRTAGGLILILSAVPMVMNGRSPRNKDVDTDDLGGWKTIIVVPIIFPFTIGAASLSYVITLMSSAHVTLDYIGLTAIILLDAVSIFLTYLIAVPLGQRIGSTGNNIIVRIGGIIVLALGLMILSDGLKVLLPGLAG